MLVIVQLFFRQLFIPISTADSRYLMTITTAAAAIAQSTSSPPAPTREVQQIADNAPHIHTADRECDNLTECGTPYRHLTVARGDAGQ